MAEVSRPSQRVAEQPIVDFREEKIQGIFEEKSSSQGILCLPGRPKFREKIKDDEVEKTKRRLNDVVEIGAQFDTRRQDPQTPSIFSRLFLRKETFTVTQVLAKVTVTIKGEQLVKNGAPNLVDMGWVFKWRPIVNDSNTRMQVDFSPIVGSHNLIHEHSSANHEDVRHINPHLEAKGILSVDAVSWIKRKTQTVRRFTTFSLTCTPADGKFTWQWHQTKPSENNHGGDHIRDPQLCYQFGFCFTFKKPDKASRTAAGSATKDPLLFPAVEISFCDFEVNFEAKTCSTKG